MIKTLVLMTTALILTSSEGKAQTNNNNDIMGRQETVQLKNGLMTPEALWAMGRIGGYSVSPDNKKLVYNVSYYSVSQNKSHTVIFISNTDGSGKQLLTKTKNSESEVTFIKDGRKIAFLASDKNGISQIWEMDQDGNNRKQLSFSKRDIEGFRFSPDENKVIYITEFDLKPIEGKKIYKDLPKTSGYVADDVMFRHWDSWVTTAPHPHVASFDGNKIGESTDLLANEPYESPMRPFGGIEQINWSPDGKYIVYTCRKKTGMAYATSTDSDIYLYETATGKTINLCKDFGDSDKNMGYDTNPSFSPDGKYIAWQSMARDGYESDRNRLCLMNLKTHRKTYLTESFDSDVNEFIWANDSKTLYFTGVWHGETSVYRTNLNAQVKKVAGGQYDFNSIAIYGKDLMCKRQSMEKADEIYIINLAQKGSCTQVTQENKQFYDQLAIGKVEPRWSTTVDGKQMLSWIIYPPHFDKNKKYPTVLFCEGGPQSPVSQFWSFRWNMQIMAANGYIVVAPNRRGLPGFGSEWKEEISGNYGGKCMDDYLTAIDDICKEPYVDKDRLGCVGASFGGYSVYYLMSHHNKRFKCFIAHDGFFNMEQQYLETEEAWFTNWDLGGNYWNKDNTIAQRSYSKYSPHLYVDKWDTPILCIHGEKDYRILASQGIAAFNAARYKGIPAELLLFPDENHWVLKPQNGILWQRTFFNWLDKWLKK